MHARKALYHWTKLPAYAAYLGCVGCKSMDVGVHSCVYVKARSACLLTRSTAVLCIYWDRVSHWIWSRHFSQTGWPLSSWALLVSAPGLVYGCAPPAPAFCGCQGSWLRPLRTLIAESSPQPNAFFINTWVDFEKLPSSLHLRHGGEARTFCIHGEAFF